jgi:SAM-dependent methyltransferase
VKALVDNWGLFLLTRELAEMLGGLRGLKLFMRHEQYRLAAAVRAALECGADCRRPPNDFATLLFSVARYKGILKEGCQVAQVPEPGEPPPHAAAEYFQMFDDVVLDRICEYVAKPPSDVVSEEDAMAYYQALMSAPFYVAFRRAVYGKLARLYKYSTILDVGAGTQDPLDILAVCEMHGARCRLTAHEVDQRLCADLERLASKHGFDVVCGWGRLDSYDVAVVQNVLHWATDPLHVLTAARRHARHMFLSQGVVEGAGTAFVLTKVLGAVRSLSWREVEALAKQAGWRLARRYAKYPDYLALYR